MKKFFILLLITPLASQELVDVLWGKSNLSNPYTYDQLNTFIKEGSKFESNFMGTISIGKILGQGFTVLVDDYNIHGKNHNKIPEFSIDISFQDSHVVPADTGLIKTSHPFWDIQFGIGKSYYHSLSDVAVMLLPFSLMHKNANCVHTGVGIFSLDKSYKVSNVIFQIASETCAYYKFDYVAVYEANLIDLKTDNKYSNIDFNLDSKNTLEDIYESYQIKPNSFGDSKDFIPANMTIHGLIDGDTNLFQSSCTSRLGDNIFCNEIVLPSYSLAKSIAGTISLTLLNNKYEDISQYNVADLIPQCNAKKWSNITLENLADMATGQYLSTDFDFDESSRAMTRFLFNSNQHDKKVKLACKIFPQKKKPGKTFVYHTSDTYLLGAAMNNYLSTISKNMDYFDDLLVPFLRSKNFSEISQHSLRTEDKSNTAYTGWGMYLNPSDLKKLSIFLHSIKNNKSSSYSFLHEALNPNYSNSLAAIKSADIYYNNGFWSKVFDKDIFGCNNDIWIPFMSGFGGITFALFPNGMSYYYFSDGYVYSWNDAAIAAHKMRSFCTL